MREISRTLAALLPARSAHARLAAAPARLEPAELDALVGRARDTGCLGGHACPGETASELAEVFETAHANVASAASGLDCAPGEQVLIVPRLVGSVLRPLADALSKIPAGPVGPPTGPEAPGQAGTAGTADSPGQPGATGGTGTRGQAGITAAGGRVWEAAKAASVLWARPGRAGSCPPELAEAAAAIQDLACRLVLRQRSDRQRGPAGRITSKEGNCGASTGCSQPMNAPICSLWTVVRLGAERSSLGSRAFACAHTVTRLCSGVSAGPPGRWPASGPAWLASSLPSRRRRRRRCTWRAGPARPWPGRISWWYAGQRERPLPARRGAAPPHPAPR